MPVQSADLYEKHLKRKIILDLWFKLFGLSFSRIDVPFLGPIINVTIANRSILCLLNAITLSILCLSVQIHFVIHVPVDLFAVFMCSTNSAISLMIAMYHFIKDSTRIEQNERKLLSLHASKDYEFKNLKLEKAAVAFHSICWLYVDVTCIFQYVMLDNLKGHLLVGLEWMLATIAAKAVVVVLLKCSVGLFVLEESMWNLNRRLKSLVHREGIENEFRELRKLHHETCYIARKTYDYFSMPIVFAYISNFLISIVCFTFVTRLSITVYDREDGEYYSIVLSSIITLTHLISLWMVSDASTRFVKEARSTNLIVQAICFSSESKNIHQQSKQFSTQLLLSNMKPMAGGCFQLDNKHFFMTLGSLAAFNIITYQLGLGSVPNFQGDDFIDKN